jgi:hypothetical protein
LNTIQWLKLDTQGTDLRIFTSISAKLKSHLLAVDLEPGIIPFYQDEDIFEKLHKELIQQGFWLSQSRVLGSVRVSQSTLIKYPQLKEGFKHLKTSPGWVEARYLRTLESLQEQHVPKTDYVLLWLFAMLDKQYGYALDVIEGYRQGFGEDALFQKMHHEVVNAIKAYLPSPTLQTLKSIFPRSLKRGLKNSLKQWLAKFQS